MSAETKQLFHNPEELTDAELDILRLKLQNQRRLPKIGAVFGLTSAACLEAVAFRRNPTLLMMGIGAAAGYAFAGYGTSTMTTSMLKREFDHDIITAQERRQQAKTMNLAGFGNNHINGQTSLEGGFSYDKPY